MRRHAVPTWCSSTWSASALATELGLSPGSARDRRETGDGETTAVQEGTLDPWARRLR
jgi:hypothetical protein